MLDQLLELPEHAASHGVASTADEGPVVIGHVQHVADNIVAESRADLVLLNQDMGTSRLPELVREKRHLHREP